MTDQHATRSGTSPIETQTIAPIPADERFGRSRDLFGIWFGMNMSPLTVVTGALATVSIGLPVGWAIVAILAGNAVGGVAMALHAAQGPTLGVPQLLQARGQFGLHGASLITLLAIAMFVGFFASNLVIIGQAFTTAVPALGTTTVMVLATVVSIVIACFGYRILRGTTITAAIVVGSLVAVSFVWIFLVNDTSSYQWSTGEFTAVGFLSMFAVAAVWQIAYAPYVSDYSRYMRADTGARGAFWGTYGGCVSSSVILMVLGAFVGTILNETDTMSALHSLVGPVGTVVLLGFAIATAAYNSVNTYCSALCILSVTETFRSGWIPGVRSRILATIVINLLGLSIALMAQADFLAFFYDFVTWMLYLLIPWSAINLVDYYIIEKGHYEVADFFRPGGGRYGNWNATALGIYAVGIAVQVPFISTSAYTGFLVDNLGGIDIAWLVGLLVSAVGYYLVARKRRRPSLPADTTGPNTGAVR